MVHATDAGTIQLASLNVGSTIFEIKGPFGHPLNIENFGRVLCIGRGSAILLLLPVLHALKVAGNHVVTVLLAPTQEGLILQNGINAVSDELILLTDDGTIGENEPFCHLAGKILRSNRFNQVLAIGPAKTIKEIYSLSKKYNIPTQAVLYVGKTVESKLNGIFKVSICSTAKSVCIDGFNFNAYYPNFEEMAKRFGNEDSVYSTYSMFPTK
jgi:NAD(P)H-flavin reductase